MKVALEKPGTPEELAHVGVKGMKWGVRKTRGTEQFKAKFTTSSARAEEIHRARKSVQAATAKGNLASQYDRATALRFTRGEKVVAALLYTMAPTVIVPAGVAGYTAVKVGQRRALQK